MKNIKMFLKNTRRRNCPSRPQSQISSSKDCRWDVIQKQAEGIGHKLNVIFDKLTNANSPKS